MKKFNNTMNVNKKISKFGVVKQSSLRNAKTLMDLEKIETVTIEEAKEDETVINNSVMEEEEIKEEIIIIQPSFVEEKITFDVIHPNNIKQDVIIPKDEITKDKPKLKTKLADAIRIMMLKKKNGWE